MGGSPSPPDIEEQEKPRLKMDVAFLDPQLTPNRMARQKNKFHTGKLVMPKKPKSVQTGIQIPSDSRAN
jgi:hypothetical protein